MMSLTAMLLTGAPPNLPQGRKRMISSDTERKNSVSNTPAHSGGERNQQIKSGNIERVYQAVASGFQTVLTIAEEAGLSISTVNKALHDLEDWLGGGRVQRITSHGNQHRFQIKEQS